MKSEAIRRCIGIVGNRVSDDVAVDCPYTAAAAEAELAALETRIEELGGALDACLSDNEAAKLFAGECLTDETIKQGESALANVGQHPTNARENPPSSGGKIVEVPIEMFRSQPGTWFWKNCRANRRNNAKCCAECPFREMIEQEELGNLLGSPEAEEGSE